MPRQPVGHQKRELAREGFIVPWRSLLPGDILLFASGKQNPLQLAISAFTHSPYTHAAICIGKGQIAESKLITGVQIYRLKSTGLKQADRIGVLRTQATFSNNRATAVRSFVEELVKNRVGYDLKEAGKWKKFTPKGQAALQAGLLEELLNNYGEHEPQEQFLKRSYFCSALVVACYTVAGLIGNTAQIAYDPKTLSPGGLYADPTFGWFLGYLLADGGSVPHDDPLLTDPDVTHWRDNLSARWWS